MTQGARRDSEHGRGKKGHIVRLLTDAMIFHPIWRSHQGPPPTFTASRVMSQSEELTRRKPLSTCLEVERPWGSPSRSLELIQATSP